MQRKSIPAEVFTLVRKWAYTPTADFIPTRIHRGERQFLLARRKEKPWKGAFFFPGGRIAPGETPEEGMLRGCRRELGFIPDLLLCRFLLWQSIYNPECEHEGEPYFTMSGCWQIEMSHDQVVCLDSTQSEYRWFDAGSNKKFAPYVQKAIDLLR